MKVKTNILCYSGIQKCNSNRVKYVDYTVIDLSNGNSKRKINKRYTK